MKTCTSNLLLEYIFSAIFTSYLAVHFAKRNTKFGGGESEGGAGIPFPQPPFLPAPPERSVWRAKRAISSVQKRFAHFQTKGTKLDFLIFGKPKPMFARPDFRRGSQGIGRQNQTAGRNPNGFFFRK